jgi:general nucleoside transport system permease protein
VSGTGPEIIGAAAILWPALRQTTPLVLAGLGGIFSERVGVINIALEGMMLVGAFVGMWAGQVYGLPWGLAAALVSGALLGLLHVLLTQRLRMNHVVSGVAINILALNATTFLVRRVFHQASPAREAKLPAMLPVGWFIAAAIVLPFVVHFLLYRTALGLRLRAVGESAESARMAGIRPLPLRIAGVVTSGILAAGAGAYLSMSQVGRFGDDMVAGRGFIALAAIICGRWTPLGTALACLAFGLCDALQFSLQGVVRLPGELLRTLPYLFTIAAATLVRPVPPAGLGKDEE